LYRSTCHYTHTITVKRRVLWAPALSGP
jgi:hypothetical protein